MQSSLFVMAVIIAVAAVVVGLWSPGRDGTLRPVRWLTSRRPVRWAGKHRAGLARVSRPRRTRPPDAALVAT